MGGESDSILRSAELEDSLRLLCVAQRSQVSHKFWFFVIVPRKMKRSDSRQQFVLVPPPPPPTTTWLQPTSPPGLFFPRAEATKRTMSFFCLLQRLFGGSRWTSRRSVGPRR